jgi:hypothetical protein
VRSQLTGCSLSPTELEMVRERYAAAASDYQATIEMDDDRARVSLRGDKQRLKTFLNQMIAQEAGCCSFLRFDPSETADGFLLELSIAASGGPEVPPQFLAEALRAFFPTATTVSR